MDVRLREGESLRALKLATIAQFDKFESESQNLLCCYDNELLRKKKKFYRELQNSGKLIWGPESPIKNDKEGGINTENANDSTLKKKGKSETEKKESKIKVIASRTFLHNPHMNKHKILKANKKLYVLP